ncbi:MAG: M23 family metallopeptidase [Treponema sp.]|jgi:murein DD-endopeptidase MepM/ murein hydrolase activator NlpD|nr:M23 family metallopeptidase [Treponema sp.]
MKIKKIIIFGILFFLLGLNFGYTTEDEIPLTEIPNIWPVKDGSGIISMYFGQNINPIHGQTFFHRGIDIAAFRTGDAIIATADGDVITAEYDYSHGNFIVIKHNHGFQTLYAHLLDLRVQVGQRVLQGEIIGHIGNTGISVGPHLHYEIHTLSGVVDPLLYITDREIPKKYE